MPTHSPLSPTVCGGIGAITLMDGVGELLTTVGAGTVGMARAGVSVGAAGMAAAGGDTITILTIIPDGIPVADTGGMVIGEMPIPTDVLIVRADHR